MQKHQQPLKLHTLVWLLLWLLDFNAEATDTTTKNYACDQKNPSLLAFPFCNTSLPIADRVKDYIDRLTLEEKIHLLGSNSIETIGVPRLGVPPVTWWNEALHGIAWSPGVEFGGPVPAATSFPMPNIIAATFNSSLFFLIGQVVSTEARAMHNVDRAGLTFWSPNINIYRDPRWGRGQETPGEDPLLAGTYAAEYVKGMQNTSSSNEGLKVSACCKHITAYDIDNSAGITRYGFNALVTEQDLKDTFNAPFQMCVEEGRASCLMCSYNSVNGVPNCADRKLLDDTIRKTWHFDGYITTDTDSVQTYYNYSNYASSEAEAAADALIAGVDLNSGTFVRNYTMDAIRQNMVNESTIDKALSHTTRVLMRLGFFDGDPSNLVYGAIGPDQVCSEDHKRLALETSRQGLVLLKNLGVLPLSPRQIKSVAVVGPHGNATFVMTGNYAGVPCGYTTVLQGLRKYTDIVHAPGCPDVKCNSKTLFDEATNAASKADAVVLVMGLDLEQECEGIDRTSLLLPGHQQDLVSDVMKAAKGPVVLVILSGGSVDVSFAVNDSRVGGIIWAGYPGQDGGQALAEVIFGDYNPGGRLPTTWYPESYTQIDITNMNMRPDASTGYPGRTYKFFTGPTLFDFGYGLSYTKVTEKFYKVPDVVLTVPSSAAVSKFCTSGTDDCFHIDATDADTCNQLKTDITVEVRNEGPMPSSHALLLYSIPPNAGLSGAPLRQLVAFKRVLIGKDSSVRVEFHTNPCKDLSYAAADGSRILPGGTHKLVVGTEQHEIRVQAAAALASA